ncbi:MAG: hypothetical protein WC565_05505 [Parcubacteria group bacterium]
MAWKKIAVVEESRCDAGALLSCEWPAVSIEHCPTCGRRLGA